MATAFHFSTKNVILNLPRGTHIKGGQTNYLNPLYEGESADAANKSAYPKTFSESLTFELYKHHQEISEAAKP